MFPEGSYQSPGEDTTNFPRGCPCPPPRRREAGAAARPDTRGGIISRRADIRCSMTAKAAGFVCSTEHAAPDSATAEMTVGQGRVVEARRNGNVNGGPRRLDPPLTGGRAGRGAVRPRGSM